MPRLVVYIDNVKVVDKHVDVSATTFARELAAVRRTSAQGARARTSEAPRTAATPPAR